MCRQDRSQTRNDNCSTDSSLWGQNFSEGLQIETLWQFSSRILVNTPSFVILSILLMCLIIWIKNVFKNYQTNSSVGGHFMTPTPNNFQALKSFIACFHTLARLIWSGCNMHTYLSPHSKNKESGPFFGINTCAFPACLRQGLTEDDSNWRGKAF